MTTSPVMSVTDELVAELQREFDRNGPCPHETHNPIGFGHWVRCDDCGRDVPSEYLEKAKLASEKHDELSAVLRALLSERAELKRDSERYRWLCNGNGYFMEENMLCHVAYEKDEADAAIDAAMQESKP